MTSRNSVELKSNNFRVINPRLATNFQSTAIRLPKIHLDSTISSRIRLRRPSLPSLSSNFTTIYCNLIDRFRESIRSGDYFSAVGCIHSYFDHTVSMQLSPPEATWAPNSQSALTVNRNYYQFALLHLATLHSEFGNYSDAAWVILSSILI